MENIGDWLYVIILAIAGIASMIKSFGKKDKQNGEQEQQPGRTILDDIFDTTPQVYENSVKAPHIETKQTKYRFHQQQEGVSSIAQTNTDAMFADIENEHAQITAEDLPTNTEDWRKALIYSEIFNRKY